MRPPGPSKEYCKTINYAIEQAELVIGSNERILDDMRLIRKRFPDAQRTHDTLVFTSASLSIRDCDAVFWNEENAAFEPYQKTGWKCRVHPVTESAGEIRLVSVSAYNLSLSSGQLLEAVKAYLDEQ